MPTAMPSVSSRSITAHDVSGVAAKEPEPVNVSALIDAAKKHGYHPSSGGFSDENGARVMPMIGMTSDGKLIWIVASPDLYPTLPICPLLLATYQKLQRATVPNDGLPGFLADDQRVRAVAVRNGAGILIRLDIIES